MTIPQEDEAFMTLAYALVSWLLTTVVISAYWLGAEAEVPGQQYADPLFPCIYCGMLIGIPLGLFARLVVVVARRVR